jgi:hypothetical protein
MDLVHRTVSATGGPNGGQAIKMAWVTADVAWAWRASFPNPHSHAWLERAPGQTDEADVPACVASVPQLASNRRASADGDPDSGW